MTTETAVLDSVDIFADEVLENPYEAYGRLRDQAAAVYIPARDLWAVTRYEAVREALGDPGTFSSTAVAFNPQMNEVLKGTTLATDPPDHQHLRKVLSQNLSPRALRSVKADIETKADTMVRELAERDEFDGMQDLARALPLNVVVDMIGIKDPEIRAKILTWGEAAFNLLGPMNERAQASFPVAKELFDWTHNIQVSDLTEGSMGHGIFAAAERGDIAYESCGMIIHQYVAAGMDTTIASIGNAIMLFAEHPEQYAKVREDPALIPSAFNEVLRMHSPLPATGRKTMRDVEVDDVVIPEGSQVALLLAGGNRDERHYPNADTFDVTRNPVDHLTFGYGIHGCAGQGLARLEAYAAIGSLAKYIKSYSVGDFTRKITNTTRSYESILVTDIVRA